MNGLAEPKPQGRIATRRVLADGGPYTLELRIPVDADLDGTFRAECLETGEILSINGWLFTFEDLKD